MAEKTTAFTGPVVVGLNDKKGEIRLTDGKNVNEAKYLSIAAPDTITSDTTLTFPNGAGTAGQILSTDGNGTLSWVNDSAGNPDGSNGQVQFNDNGAFGAIPDGTSGQVLKSNGAGVAPSFQEDTSGIAAVVDDTSPQLGGNLDLNGNDITGTGDINYTGALNASGSTIKLDGPFPTGTSNTVLGPGAGSNATSNFRNSVAIGTDALRSGNIQQNTAIGYRSMRSTSTGSNNVAVGAGSLEINSTGDNNVAIGASALFINTGSKNTAVGGDSCLGNGSNLTNCTAVGNSAGSSLGGGGAAASNVTCIGYDSEPSAPGASNEITLGDTNVTSLRIPGLQSGASTNDVLTFNGTDITLAAAPDPATIDIDTSNVFISDNPAPSKTTAINNTGIGVNSLLSITNAAENVAIGKDAVRNKSTSGSGAVTAVGFMAMNLTTTGGSNTAVGRRCQSGNTTGSNNTAMGDRALSSNNADSNTAIGNLAMQNNVSGQQNTVVGDNAGIDLTGNSNTAVGFQALKNAGTISPSGDENTAIGKQAGAEITSGRQNAIVGNNAGLFMNGFGSVAVGYSAGNSFPHTGSQNTYLGYQAGNSHGTGNNSTMIGNDAQASTASVSNEITLGNSSVSTLRCQVTSITALSDARDKKDVEDANIGLDFINDLRPVKFVWDTRDGAKKDIKEVGFIAQELDEVQQKHGVEDHLQLVLKNNPDKLEASQGKLIPILVQAIKDLKKEIDELKKA